MVLQLDNPTALWGLVGVALLMILMIWRGLGNRGTFSSRRITCVTLGFSLCVLALARPQLGERVSSPQRVASNLYIAIDVSRSMLAQDISPSRLGFAIEFSKKLLPLLVDTKVALFPFAMGGFLQLPLTSDLYAVADQISTLHPSMTTAQGTDLSDTLKTLFTRIARTENAVRERNGDWVPARVLLLSDGESHSPVPSGSAEMFKKHQIPIFTVGIGSPKGITIPVEARFGGLSENLRGPDGRNVQTKMVAENLQKISNETGGDYFPASFSELARLASRLNQSLALGKLQSSFKLRQEFFPWILAAALALFLLEFSFGRWEYLVRVAVPLLILLSPTANAGENTDPRTLPIDKYNAGVEAVKEKDLRKAAELFEEAAIIADDPQLKKQSYYNLGNMLLKMGDPAAALQTYQQAYDITLQNATKTKTLNKTISDNMQLAAEMELQQQSGESSKDPKESKDQQPGQDPHGPKKFQKQPFSEKQKERIWDLVSNEEKQSQQRLRDQQNRGSSQNRTEKPW